MKLRMKMLSVAVSVLALAAGTLAGPAETDKNLIVFVSDTHIREKEADGKPDDPGAAAKLTACVQKILAKKPCPCAVIFCGDLTDYGRPGQMARFRALIQPLRDAGIPCRLLPGNHDYYGGRCQELFAGELAASAVPDKVASVVETPMADIVCLDTPDMVTQDGWWGRIDGAQLAWLKTYLQKNGGRKPTFICAHHPLYLVPVPAGVGMFRSAAGWIGGHRHIYKVETPGEGVPQIYVPSTVQDPFGYVEMRRAADGFSFTLITEGEKDARNGETLVIKDKRGK